MAAPPRCSFLKTYIGCCPTVPVQFAVHGAAGHNRWGVAETPLPVKTQGRNMDRFETYCVCRALGWLLTPRGETSGVMGAVLSASALGARGWRRGRRFEYRSVAPGRGVQRGSQSTRRTRGGGPENRPEAHGADSASTPRRATIPRTGGQRTKDRQADALRF